MKKKYETVKIEIIELEAQDVITTSSPEDPFDSSEQPFYMMPELDHMN